MVKDAVTGLSAENPPAGLPPLDEAADQHVFPGRRLLHHAEDVARSLVTHDRVISPTQALA
jgi:hypothetical protein